MESKINIFVACHKPTCVLENPLFVPVQVGAALSEWRGDGMKYDNEGDNISEKNPEYCELTAHYWAWKNMECDYYGFFHYRRYLSFANIYPIEADGTLRMKKGVRPYIELDDILEDLSPFCLEETRMQQEIEKYDLITVLRERINTTVYRQYCQYHPKKSLDLILDILKRKYPEYASAASEYMNSRDIYYMNMYIMKKSLFKKYMNWLFDILFDFENCTEIDECARHEPRLMGYLAERLFGVFYTYQREHGAVCAELPYLKFYNTDGNGGGVTRSNVRVFRLKPTKYEIKVDMRKLNRLFPAGSRRRILLRSIFLR